MKKHFLSFFFLFCISFADAQITTAGDCTLGGRYVDPNGPIMAFDSLSKNFGTVNQGDAVNLKFHFTNTGKAPLIIESATTSNSSSYADYSREPIPPNGNGTIQFHYSTTGKIGPQDKTIFITSNNRNGQVVLHALGKIVFPDTALFFIRTLINGDTLPAMDERRNPIVSSPYNANTCYAFFDTVKGKRVIIDYQFLNKGNSPILIMSAMGSAGSVVPSYEKGEIPIGGTGNIHVEFMIDGVKGMQSKTVTVSYFLKNNPDKIVFVVLHLQGYISS